MLENFAIDYKEILNKLDGNQNMKPVKGNEDKMIRVAFDFFRLKDADPETLWQVQKADDGQEYLMRTFSDDESEEKLKVESDWDVQLNKEASDLTIYKSDVPVHRMNLDKMKIGREESESFRAFVLGKLRRKDSSFLQSLAMEMPLNKIASLKNAGIIDLDDTRTKAEWEVLNKQAAAGTEFLESVNNWLKEAYSLLPYMLKNKASLTAMLKNIKASLNNHQKLWNILPGAQEMIYRGEIGGKLTAVRSLYQNMEKAYGQIQEFPSKKAAMAMQKFARAIPQKIRVEGMPYFWDESSLNLGGFTDWFIHSKHKDTPDRYYWREKHTGTIIYVQIGEENKSVTILQAKVPRRGFVAPPKKYDISYPIIAWSKEYDEVQEKQNIVTDDVVDSEVTRAVKDVESLVEEGRRQSDEALQRVKRKTQKQRKRRNYWYKDANVGRVQKLLGFSGRQLDSKWGPKTRNAWNTFIKNNPAASEEYGMRPISGRAKPNPATLQWFVKNFKVLKGQTMGELSQWAKKRQTKKPAAVAKTPTPGAKKPAAGAKTPVAAADDQWSLAFQNLNLKKEAKEVTSAIKLSGIPYFWERKDSMGLTISGWFKHQAHEYYTYNDPDGNFILYVEALPNGKGAKIQSVMLSDGNRDIEAPPKLAAKIFPIRGSSSKMKTLKSKYDPAPSGNSSWVPEWGNYIKYLVTTQELAPGTVLSHDNITWTKKQRRDPQISSGGYVPYSKLKKIIGHKLTVPVREHGLIPWSGIKGNRRRKTPQSIQYNVSVSNVQKVLSDLGYYRDTIDGKWGPNSRNAWNAFVGKFTSSSQRNGLKIYSGRQRPSEKELWHFIGTYKKLMTNQPKMELDPVRVKKVKEVAQRGFEKTKDWASRQISDFISDKKAPTATVKKQKKPSNAPSSADDQWSLAFQNLNFKKQADLITKKQQILMDFDDCIDDINRTAWLYTNHIRHIEDKCPLNKVQYSDGLQQAIKNMQKMAKILEVKGTGTDGQLFMRKYVWQVMKIWKANHNIIYGELSKLENIVRKEKKSKFLSERLKYYYNQGQKFYVTLLKINRRLKKEIKKGEVFPDLMITKIADPEEEFGSKEESLEDSDYEGRMMRGTYTEPPHFEKEIDVMSPKSNVRSLPLDLDESDDLSELTDYELAGIILDVTEKTKVKAPLVTKLMPDQGMGLVPGSETLDEEEKDHLMGLLENASKELDRRQDLLDEKLEEFSALLRKFNEGNVGRRSRRRSELNFRDVFGDLDREDKYLKTMIMGYFEDWSEDVREDLVPLDQIKKIHGYIQEKRDYLDEILEKAYELKDLGGLDKKILDAEDQYKKAFRRLELKKQGGPKWLKQEEPDWGEEPESEEIDWGEEPTPIEKEIKIDIDSLDEDEFSFIGDSNRPGGIDIITKELKDKFLDHMRDEGQAPFELKKDMAVKLSTEGDSDGEIWSPAMVHFNEETDWWVQLLAGQLRSRDGVHDRNEGRWPGQRSI